MEYIGELGMISFLHYLWQRCIQRHKILKIYLHGLQEPVHIRNQPSDHALFTQIFIHKEYGRKSKQRVLKMIDCGANIGLAALYFLREYPTSEITCFEPDAANFSILKLNTENYKNITCYLKAVWHVETGITVFGESRGAAGLMVKEADVSDEYRVEAVTLDKFIKTTDRIDLLKMDIEGSEKQVLLDGKTGWVNNIETMFIELHDDIHPGITDLIIRKFRDQFSIRQAGEYHVFERM